MITRMPLHPHEYPFQFLVTDNRVVNEDGSINQFIHGSPQAAGYDILAWPEQEVQVLPGAVEMIPTGVRLWINSSGIVGMLYPRSGLGVKKGIVLANGTGVIDSDYQGPMMVALWNRSDQVFTVTPGDRIAQIVFMPVAVPRFIRVQTEWETTIRGEGGFGSTGVAS